jgi:hypothetical protein
MSTVATTAVPIRMATVNAFEAVPPLFVIVNVRMMESPVFAVVALNVTPSAESGAQTVDVTVIVTAFDVADDPGFPARS